MKRNDILLAMGSPALLKSMEEALLREGLSVETAGNGIDAIMDAVNHRPRSVLCGQVLAGVDGIKACRLLRSLIPADEMPVLVSIPDSKPEMGGRALRAGASAVVDYSTSPGEIAELVRDQIAGSVNTITPVEFPLSRDRVLPMAADCIEETLEILETVIRLAGDLKGASSITEACRKVSAVVLGGLGFQRVWIGMPARSGSELEAVAFRGRGVTGDPIPLAGKLPADTAATSGKQVLSWQCDQGLQGIEWAGSSIYIDTPFFSGVETAGIIRCDNGLSRRQPGKRETEALQMAADLLSSFVRYLGVQGTLDSHTYETDRMLKNLGVISIRTDRQGIIRECSGDMSAFPELSEPAAGVPFTNILQGFSRELSEDFENTVVRDGMDISRKHVPIGDSGDCIGIACEQRPPDSIIVTVTDRTAEGRLADRVEELEVEIDAMASMAADLTSETDAGEICRIIARTVENFYSQETIAVLAPESSSTSFQPESLVVYAVSGARTGRAALLPGATVVLNDSSESGVLGEAVRKARITNVPDVLNSEFFITGMAESRSELAVPLLCRGRIVGLIDVQSPATGRFQADDLRRLNNISGFAAGALESALQQTELINLARRDRLTGLHNMTYFEERYPEEFERALRYEYSFSLIMMDIDDFKNYNDTYGHPMGNVLLQRVTRAMDEALREVDILVRYGGEEFICVLPLTDKPVAVEIAERIRLKVLEANDSIPNAASQPRGCVSLSLGVSTFPEDSREQAELVEIADQRMYRAKRAGKNMVCHS